MLVKGLQVKSSAYQSLYNFLITHYLQYTVYLYTVYICWRYTYMYCTVQLAGQSSSGRESWEWSWAWLPLGQRSNWSPQPALSWGALLSQGTRERAWFDDIGWQPVMTHNQLNISSSVIYPSPVPLCPDLTQLSLCLSLSVAKIMFLGIPPSSWLLPKCVPSLLSQIGFPSYCKLSQTIFN